ncbi:MAG: protein translocase subunit SecD [Alphaproteobacteria bacterium]|nr:protein translocase subunit SecD [Alphaproteobacteria bacterium SS10]
MVHFSKFKIFSIVLLCVLSLLYAVPNVVGDEALEEWQSSMPSWLPGQTVNLGLDLQGGSYRLLRVEFQDVLQQRVRDLRTEVRNAARGARIRISGLATEGLSVVVRPQRAEQIDELAVVLADLNPDFELIQEGADENSPPTRIRLNFRQFAQDDLTASIMQQAIEVIRRRVDALGTTEPLIQQQGDDRILVQLPGATSFPPIPRGQLSIHLVDINASQTQIAQGNAPEGSQIVPYAESPLGAVSIRRDPIVRGDNLVGASTGVGIAGDPVVNFRFDGEGARKFGDATVEHTGRQMAIVLDGEVLSAPVIREPILGGAGQISGNFTVQDASDLALILRSGALPAELTPLEERTVGPSLGADSVAAGQTASLIAIGFVTLFMIAAYGLFGGFAMFALSINIAAIFALLSALGATLTLPGIAGIVLTIGIAVDANVLIFERIREELRNGRTPISAIDSGYGRALTTIIDASLTTLIAAACLFAFGAGPIRGFAVTLAVGILTSMFTAIMVTRLMVVLWLRQTKPSTLPL